MSTPFYRVLLPILLVSAVIIVGVTVGVVAGTTGRSEIRTEEELGPAPPTVTTTTTLEPTTTPAPPPSTIPSCAGATRVMQTRNNSVVLPQNATFSWDVLSGTMTQSFLNGNLIATDPIVSAVRYGDRYLVTQLDSSRLTSLMLDGTVIQDIFVFIFPNVYGMVMDAGRLYVLSSDNNLLRLQIGATFAVIEGSTPMPVLSRYITVDPNTSQPYVLLQNGTIATLNLSDASVQSVCTPDELDYDNIGFDPEGNLVGALPFNIDTITLA